MQKFSQDIKPGSGISEKHSDSYQNPNTISNNSVNIVSDGVGRLARRPGTTFHRNVPDCFSVISDEGLGNLYVTNNSVYADSYNGTEKLAGILPVKIEDEFKYVSNRSQKGSDIARIGDVTAVTYFNEEGCSCVFYSGNSKSDEVDFGQIGNGDYVRIRVASLGNDFLFFLGRDDGAGIDMAFINANDAVVSNFGAIDFTDIFDSDYLEMDCFSSDGVVAFAFCTGDAYVVRRYLGGGIENFTEEVFSATAHHISVVNDSSSLMVVSFVDNTNMDIYIVSLDEDLLEVGNTWTIGIIDTVRYVGLGKSPTKNATLLWTKAEPSAPDPVSDAVSFAIEYDNSVTLQPVLCHIFHALGFCRPILFDGQVLLPAFTRFSGQFSYWLFNTDGDVVCRFNYGSANVAFNRDDAAGFIDATSGYVSDADSFTIAVDRRVNRTVFTAAFDGVYSFFFPTEAVVKKFYKRNFVKESRTASSLCIPLGVLYEHGSRFHENGFLESPKLYIELIPTVGGALKAGKTYKYRGYWERISDNGGYIKSGELLTHTVSPVSDSTASITVLTLSKTIDRNVRFALFRTTEDPTGDAVYFRCTSQDVMTGDNNLVLNDRDVFAKTVVDSKTDAELLLATEQDYRLDEFPNWSPGNVDGITVAGGRAWVFGNEVGKGRTVFSKTRLGFGGIDFCEENEVIVESPFDVTACMGNNTGINVFTSNEVFFLSGDGPSRSSSSPSGFQLSGKISDRIGADSFEQCEYVRSGFVFMFSGSLFFISSSSGFEISNISRDMSNFLSNLKLTFDKEREVLYMCGESKVFNMSSKAEVFGFFNYTDFPFSDVHFPLCLDVSSGDVFLVDYNADDDDGTPVSCVLETNWNGISNEMLDKQIDNVVLRFTGTWNTMTVDTYVNRDSFTLVNSVSVPPVATVPIDIYIKFTPRRAESVKMKINVSGASNDFGFHGAAVSGFIGDSLSISNSNRIG